VAFETDATSSTPSAGRTSNENGPSRSPKGVADPIPHRLLTMPVIIDGNNLLHSLPTDQRDRSGVRRRALDVVRHEGTRLTVVFDGPPPPGSPDVEHLGRVVVRYSGSSSADDVIVGLLASRGRAVDWVVVSDDRVLRKRVRERGARVRTLREWRSRTPRKPRRSTAESKLSSREIADWEAYFSSGGDDDTQR